MWNYDCEIGEMIKKGFNTSLLILLNHNLKNFNEISIRQKEDFENYKNGYKK